ncbi:MULTISPECIES: ABC transporter permease [unclassified Campylobacter]|uniref:ABC transporter permease n=1 Tax=unclassified Campylobacter TaxID=2593542 RepID=UPI0012382F0A|nr:MULTISPECIES: FtsX-like permease family protein [unclassified Campylobacter]KAA6227293.1 FtsX-like permease family protein [Campylobacter sp. LR286c]KAA6227833.1 FtsX-like permease family protein [Campylobacter sp. LR185c]KAA6228241.1 FtsX-like permease family protein [Campylobacter sp. LR196d]KAA6231046.1 FtsX-like permease family protein [Campylobacter sp. LR264d]KAA8604480.1 hypothetical protein CGP82_02865 [Campylobacter sp. LR185c]
MAGKFFITEILKSLSFSYHRLFIVFLSIFIGAMVSSAFLNIYFDIDIKLSKELKAYGANISITSKDIERNFIDNDEFNTIKESLKARAITPFLFDFLNLGSTSGIVLGTDFRSLKVTKPFLEVKEGSFNLSDFNDDTCFLGIDLAKSLQAKVRNSIQIYNPNTSKSVKLVVKGILSSSDEFDSLLIAPLKIVQNLSNISGINYATAVLDGSFEQINDKTAKLSNDLISIKPISSVSLSEAMVLDKIKALMFLIILIILVIVTTSVNTTLSSIIFSRKKEIALRLALGAKKNEILKLFSSEYAVLALISSIIGASCGIFLANIFGYMIFNASIDFRFFALILAVLISLIFSAFAAYFPIKKALKINVCDNLKGE